MSPQQQLLRDEARAWRRVAELCGESDVLPNGRGGLCFVLADVPAIDAVVSERFIHHYWHIETPFAMDEDRVSGSRVLFCLFMALEAEDELKALTPVSRPSSLRRPRQHKRGK